MFSIDFDSCNNVLYIISAPTFPSDRTWLILACTGRHQQSELRQIHAYTRMFVSFCYPYQLNLCLLSTHKMNHDAI